MKKYLILSLATLLLAACQTTNPSGITRVDRNSPVAENVTRILRNNPDPDKWNVTTNSGEQIRYACKPLACPAPSSINTVLRRSTVIKPDNAALNRMMKVDVPRIILEGNAGSDVKANVLSSSVTSRKGYPATLHEVAYTRPNGTKYFNVVYNIHAGVLTILINASSDELGVARANAANYINKLEIIQGEKIKAQLARM